MRYPPFPLWFESDSWLIPHTQWFPWQSEASCFPLPIWSVSTPLKKVTYTPATQIYHVWLLLMPFPISTCCRKNSEPNVQLLWGSSSFPPKSSWRCRGSKTRPSGAGCWRDIWWLAWCGACVVPPFLGLGSWQNGGSTREWWSPAGRSNWSSAKASPEIGANWAIPWRIARYFYKATTRFIVGVSSSPIGRYWGSTLV